MRGTNPLHQLWKWSSWRSYATLQLSRERPRIEYAYDTAQMVKNVLEVKMSRKKSSVTCIIELFAEENLGLTSPGC